MIEYADEGARTGALPSKSQLERAGRRIRKRASGESFDLDGEQAAHDIDLVLGWRSAHADALRATRIGLGTVVMRELGVGSQAGLVTQRLKRIESIVAKLVRDKPRLGEIDDIAGCRAVLEDLPTVNRIYDQLHKAYKLEIIRPRNYNQKPHAGGYRALHLCCRRDGFKVEIQLRTTRQQRWAELVEQWDNALGLDLKHENAPEPPLRYFRQLADYYGQLDNHVQPADIDVTSLEEATVAVREWLKAGGG